MRALKRSFAAITSLLLLSLVIPGLAVPDNVPVVFEVLSTGSSVEDVVAYPAVVPYVSPSVERFVLYLDELVPGVYLCSVEDVAVYSTVVSYPAPNVYNVHYFTVV